MYATCFVNYNNPAIGIAALAVLAKNGVETEIVYPGCCGMPQLEQGEVARVAESAAPCGAHSSPGSRRAMTWWRSCRPAR